MNNPKMINEALRLVRIAHGLKGKEAAEQLGLSSSYLSEIETGKKSPPLDLLIKYSDNFSISLSTLLFFAEELDRSDTIDRVKYNLRHWIFTLMRLIGPEEDEKHEQKCVQRETSA